MADHTKIPWADSTWNPMTGCTPVSEGCEHCYAERIAGRNLPVMKGHGFTPTFHPERLDVPLHWRKPRRIFVNSMSDLFHDAFVGHAETRDGRYGRYSAKAESEGNKMEYREGMSDAVDHVPESPGEDSQSIWRKLVNKMKEAAHRQQGRGAGAPLRSEVEDAD